MRAGLNKRCLADAVGQTNVTNVRHQDEGSDDEHQEL